MNINQYLKKNKLRKAEVARRLGITYSIFYYACQGYGISYKTLKKIIDGCPGVTFEDMMPTRIGRVSKRSKMKNIELQE